MTVCASCGQGNPAGFKFCGACAAPLAVAEAPRETRKIVTALFCDVTGSTALGESLDPEALRRVMRRYFEEMRVIIERHGGTVEKFIGDAVMAIFGIPKVREDDALRAVRAATEIRERLPGLAAEVGVELRFRTGVNTGSVLTGEGETLATGDAINVAARLEQAALPGEIVIGPDTLGLVRDAVEVEALEPLTLKGKAEPFRAYRLMGLDLAAAGVARRLDTPLVGRERELMLLRRAYERAVDESGCHLFTLLGPAGVGKSRLIAELLGDVDGATVLRGRCLHYGEGITFWPLVEALMPAGEVAKPVLDRLSRGGTAAPEELFWDVRRLLEELAADGPVVLYIDDLHWAEPMLFDLLDHIADLSRGAPILLLCVARPELLEARPGWGGGKLNATTVLLEPLGVEECEALLDGLGDGLDAAARRRVVQASAGNPLFLEEMVALARTGGAVVVPPTIQALLAARLETLGLSEREVLERGAVEGEVFHRLALHALAGQRLAPEIETRLTSLVRKELIRPHPSTVRGDDAFRFRHLLIRDAAYDALPKATRADLHGRFAAWLEESSPDLVELDEIAGWHLEQSARYRRELGQEADAALDRRASEHLIAAGRRASARTDPGAAGNLLARAVALMEDSDPLHARVTLELAEQHLVAGRLDDADALLKIAEADPAAGPHATLARAEWMTFARPQESVAWITARLPALLEQFEAAGDEAGQAKAHMCAFQLHWLSSQAGPAMEDLRLAGLHAERAGDDALVTRARGAIVAPMIFGEVPADDLRIALDAMESERPGPFVSAMISLGRADLARLEGRFDDGEAAASQVRAMLTALGMDVLANACEQVTCDIAISRGDLAGARAALERVDAALTAAGERAFRSTSLACLARVCALLGDGDGARAAIAGAEELSADADVINFAMTNAVRARLAVADGDAAAAERWARKSIEFADRTDFPSQRADSRLALAGALQLAGRREEAAEAARWALERLEAKGDRPNAAGARAFLDELTAAA